MNMFFIFIGIMVLVNIFLGCTQIFAHNPSDTTKLLGTFAFFAAGAGSGALIWNITQ